MARIRPFRALRPRVDLAARVAAVPYDVVSTDEARALAAGNPLSFLRVSRAELEMPPETNPYGDDVYARAKANFDTLRASALESDDEPTVYFYRLRMGDHEQTGLAACFSVADYQADRIKKHEKTRRDKEDDRTRHIIELRAQTGPVFLTYRRSAPLDALAAQATASAPLYRFTADDGVEHTIWAATAGACADVVAAMGDVPWLYIADGHHRAASAARANQHFASAEPGPDAEHAWFVAVAFPDAQTRILPYHRVVRSDPGRTAEELRAAMAARVPMREGGPTPGKKGECCAFLDGRWWTLTLETTATARDVVAGLDVSLLQERVIEPLFGISDVRTDKRIDFVGGVRGTDALEEWVRSGRAVVAFSMHPVTVDDLVAVADAGAIMPPKSTWFEPKLRDGLLTHVI